MLFENFTEQTKQKWNSYLKSISIAHKEGRLNTENKKILYPTMLIFSQCNDYYIAELIGASEKLHPLTIKKHKETSILRYLGQFDNKQSNPIIHLSGKCSELNSLCLSHTHDLDEINQRFPHLKLQKTTLLRENTYGSSITFGEDFISCSINNCTFLNKKETIYRSKTILSSILVKKSITNAELNEIFECTTNRDLVVGVQALSDSTHRVMLAGQFQSLYLFPGLRETTIGEFLKDHPEIIKKAFDAEHFEYEPSLKWIEHDGSCIDKEINPDLLIKRKDGYYDICDLKTAKLERSSVTKAERKRRRFIDYVAEGIAQLANYREYFQYPKNAALAKEKYGIKIKNPRLILVVGSWDNFNEQEVAQACRQYKDLEVIDYDTITQLYMNAQ
ncbi:hypothetical protein QF008_001369 [Pseudomonas protegens]|uniref:Shedu anti-phage system protein SduA domain-containing protein n=1 Tax=Pseudomonas protegens TaxID=380021 RepID=UPI0028958194|nr:Shedu anti-phage system protein SduA domain-containing protein [Pseudomonas protegens]MDT3419638.1 hypothetical protein [Pseudomonas protegens]